MKRQQTLAAALLLSIRVGWATGFLYLLLVVATLAPDAQAASGSWVGSAPGVRVFTPGRPAQSAPITSSSPLSSDTRIDSISWRFEPPPGQSSLEAWLCQSKRCFALSMARGTSRALSGLDANQALFFVFRLPHDAHAIKPFLVQGLQVIVNYRSISSDFPKG
ncbi:flagellar protein FlhE [Halomonas sp. M20]|uniref:flagellar protein FlhE n=1 Tax=Halomonas sp. M20 TaxID=2763264 RepID=UPI001D0A401B|nr:flagellar protein FlhE [Halomonas sp. M20]